MRGTALILVCLLAMPVGCRPAADDHEARPAQNDVDRAKDMFAAALEAVKQIEREHGPLPSLRNPHGSQPPSPESMQRARARAQELAREYREEHFSEMIANGSNPRIARAARECFQAGEAASLHEAILLKAQEVRKRDAHWSYVFWFRGKDPKTEGDGYVQVDVNANVEPRTIKAVRTVVVRK